MGQLQQLQYCERVSKLGEHLTLSLAIVLTLLIVESQTFYNGYMLLGVFSFCSFVNLIDLILQGIAILQLREPINRAQVSQDQEINHLYLESTAVGQRLDF